MRCARSAVRYLGFALGHRAPLAHGAYVLPRGRR
jgi:hypothetical protein